MSINNFITNNATGLSFTPNNAVNSVPLSLPAAVFLSASLTNPYFVFKEPVYIHDIFLFIPYQWGLANAAVPVRLVLKWKDKNANTGFIPELGANGLINLPDTNQLFPINTEIPVPATADSQWGIQLDAVAVNISMINSPAALNAVVQYCRLILRCTYTSNMIT